LMKTMRIILDIVKHFTIGRDFEYSLGI